MNARVLTRTAGTLALRSLWFAGRPRHGAMLLGLTLVAALASALVFGALFDLAQASGVARATAERVLAWAFSLAMLMLVLGDLHVVVAAATTDPDLERLRSAPITDAQVLLWKLAATLPRTSPPVLALALPAAVAFALTYGGVSPVGLVTALLLLWALPLALGTALAFPLLRAVPGARLRESLALLATLAFVCGWLANTFWLPRLPAGARDLAAALRALPAPPEWWPATWAARCVAGDPKTSYGTWLGAALALLIALAGTAWLAARLLRTVQARAAVATSRTSRASARRAPTLAAAFLRRDLALASRDWPVGLDALAGLALWFLLPLAILPLAPLAPVVLGRDMVIALSVSLGHDLAARALPLERDGLMWARCSPVGAARWLKLRLLGVALAGLVLVAVALAVVGLALRLPPAELLDVAVFGIAAGGSAIATGALLGARFGDPAWTDPRAMLGTAGRALGATLLLAQSACWLTLAHATGHSALAPGAVLLALAVTAIFALAMLVLAIRALERREDLAR